MNAQDCNPRTLAWGVGIALAIVFVAIIVMNAGEVTEIVKSEGIFY